jgi:aspartate aminotransferase
MLYMAILDPGDEIVVLEPCYPPYTHLAKMLGAKVISLSTFPSFQPDISTLRSLVTDKTKAIVLNSPNNPTGAVYPEQTLRKIANIAKKHDVLIISDEIYEHFTYDQSHFSVGSIYQNTITLNGFSKGYAMTGWRLGYLTGPLPIIDAINELLQYAVFSSSSIAQHAAIQALNHTPDIKDKYRKKRKLVVKALEGMGYQIHGAQGAYYFFLKTPHGMDDIEFVNLAVSNNLVIVPGRAFCDESTYFRISYGADLETLHKGLKILARISS